MRNLKYPLSRITSSGWGRVAAVVLVIGAVMLTVAHPHMLGALPDAPDELLHFYRVVALDHAMRHDGLWPRYAPGLIFGYGTPIFNYYGPLYLYPFEGLHLLGLSFLDAFLVGLILYAVLGALGAYLLGEAWGGPVAGVATAVAYAYAPYTLYNSPRRGAVAEFAAMAAIPWVLWAFRQAAVRGRRRDFRLAVVVYALFIPLHNITTLIGSMALVVYCVFLCFRFPLYLPPLQIQGWAGIKKIEFRLKRMFGRGGSETECTTSAAERLQDRGPCSRRFNLPAFARLALAGLLGIGLTTFFWLPALAETDYVQLERATEDASADFHNNFDAPGEILAPPLTADLTQVHPPVPRSLGWPQVVLGVVGLALALISPFTSQSGWRGWLILAMGFVIVFVFLTTEASVWVWETAPLIHYVQLPWRLVGMASLFLAVMAGAGVALVATRIPRPAGKVVWVAMCLAGMTVYAMPWLYGRALPEPPAESIVDVQNFERETGWIATSSLREYVPRWTTELPDMNALVDRYEEAEVIPRLQANPDVTVDEATWSATSAQMAIDVSAETTLVFDWLYFPGWWARVDGEDAAVAPTEPHGFVSVVVPAGEHAVETGLGPTPVRKAAGIISLAAMVGLACVSVFTRGLWRREESAPTPWPDGTRLILSAAGVVGIVLFVGKALWIDNAQTPILRERFADGVEAGLQTPVGANFGGQLVLLGYDLLDAEVASGGEARMRLYWQVAEGMVEEDYSSIVTLRDPAESVISTGGSQHPGGWPTSRWEPGDYVQERIAIEAPPGTPPGEYTIHVGLYSYSAARNLDVYDAAGSGLGVTAELGVVMVTRPRHPANVDDLAIDLPLDASLTDDLTLLGVDLPSAGREVGQPLPMMWAWRAERSPAETFGARLAWLDEDGGIAATSETVMPVVGYPTDEWAEGDVWRGIHRLHIPGRLESGSYDIAVELLDSTGTPIGGPIAIGTMAVTTPPRAYDIPAMAITTDVTWANGIRLLGYDLPEVVVSPGSGLTLTLYWEPGEEIVADLKVFVHLVDEAGAIITQQDQVPAQGTRPTLGWAPGEVIADPYVLTIGDDIPAGEYELRIGWYDAATWERVIVVDGGDYWILPANVSINTAP